MDPHPRHQQRSSVRAFRPALRPPSAGARVHRVAQSSSPDSMVCTRSSSCSLDPSLQSPTASFPSQPPASTTFLTNPGPPRRPPWPDPSPPRPDKARSDPPTGQACPPSHCSFVGALVQLGYRPPCSSMVCGFRCRPRGSTSSCYNRPPPHMVAVAARHFLPPAS